ncbi:MULTISPECIES: polysaccharide biosynthesis/export family protein [unclassified Thermosynechococcus]|uniref:SLBB domain-containing protein n=1 Tax=unclassified Thermosynechococcus TaxID=2622553 RepID=UPI0026736E0E|nr:MULTISPECIES: polysaccharide biosynthesis/export family protein [unclassified Thermosynechococcus]WKT82652.1 polysaccharide biosynthesis/export family protein [Thermosynechococcus sp. HY596]WNC61778.1 polysaccharide biosynthesis/export family protein [Thermosynechococcus sp. HY591]WNC64332.1 polysaccharide biosynthesis/export family protein [Thermosynechococcus sp. HY593]
MGCKSLPRLHNTVITLAIASGFTLGATLMVPRSATAQPMPLSPSSYSFTSINPLQDYLLGAGDVLFIEVVNLPASVTGQQQFTVNLDGSVTLPLAGRVMVGGLTLPQAEQVILNAYSKVMRFPAVTVTLQTPRPMKILVAGEVSRPGSYVVPFTSVSASAPGIGLSGGLTWPRLSQVLAQSGGITQEADIRNIEIRRQLGNGQTAVTRINLWEMIQSGDANQDITLRSDDVIVVPKAKEVNAAEAVRVASATFSPQVIRVQVVGEVLRPGLVEVPANATLTQGIGAAGGFNVQRANMSRVTLVRLNRDGTVSRRRIPFSLAAQPNANNNPVLQQGDVIVVERSGLTQVGDTIGNALRPIGALGTLGVFLNLVNIFD